MSKKRKIEKPQPEKKRLLPILFLALLAFGVYANSLGSGFVGDDEQQLVQNPVVAQHQWTAAFTSGVWAFRGVRGNYYRPLQFVVYTTLHAIFGFQASAFHLAMVLLHVLNTLLVYWLALRLLARAPAALAAAALFAIHPIHTEAVNWVAALPDVLLTAIVLFAVWQFARGASIAVHCLLYAAALLTKETGVMLAPLYVAYEWILLGRRWPEIRKNLLLYGALLATFAGYLALRWTALGGLAPGQQTFFHLTPAEFVGSAIVIAAQYAWKLVCPTGLNYFHVFHPTAAITPALLLSIVALAAAAWAAFHRATPAAVRYSLFWIATTLVPALNLTGVGQNVLAERYLYLPSVGFVLLAGFGWEWWAARQSRPAWAVGIVLLCAGSWQCVARNADWHDEFTLLQKTVAQSPDSGLMHNNLAGSYLARNDLAHAVEQERLAVQLEPRSAAFHKNLGALLMAAGDPRAAIPEFEETLRLQPAAPDVQGFLDEARRMSSAH